MMNRNMRDNFGGDLTHMQRKMGGGGGGYGNLGGGGGNFGKQMGGFGGQGNQMGGFGGQGVLGSNPGLLGQGGGGGGFGMGGGGSSGNMEMDALLQQRQLQQQLSLRESQLALANSLLLQQQSQSMDTGPGMRGGNFGMGNLGMGGGMMMNKRRQDMNQTDVRMDYKRQRRDYRSPPSNRDRRRSRDYDGGSMGNRSTPYRRNQNSSSSSSSRPSRSTDQDSSAKLKAEAEVYDPEKPTADEDERRDSGKDKDDARDKKDQFYCHVCKISCNDAGSFRLHMNGARHKKRMVDVLAEHQEKSSQLMARMKAEEHLRKIETKERSGRWCKICDQQINVRFADHARQVVHVKRLMQVNRGCGWCNTGPFNNFSEVLAHRETKEHKERQAEHEGDKGSRDERGRGSRGRSPRGGSERRSDRERRDKREESKASPKKRAEIKIELPAKLQKFDPNTPVGQNCIVPVTGFFCKLCNKFYNNEAAAKDTHCKTEPHFTKYQKFLYEKLKAKAEAERDAAEKAAAEEEKKAKADAVKTEKEGNEHEGDEENASHEPVDEDGEKAGEDAGEENQDTHANEEEEGAEDVTEGDQGGEGEEEGGEGEDPQGEEGEDPQGEEEQAENAILAEDSSALQYSFYDEAEEEHLLNEGETDGSAYATAGDDTLALDSANTTANDAKEGMGMSGVSLNAGGSVSEFLVDTSQTEEGDTEDQESVSVGGDMEGEGSQDCETDMSPKDAEPTAVTSSPRASSTPTRGRGRGRGAARGTNRARRGRKMAK